MEEKGKQEEKLLNINELQIFGFEKQSKTFSFLATPDSSVQFSHSVMSDFLQPHGLHAAHQASLSITNSQSLLKLMSIESVMPSNHLIFCRPLLLLSSVFPSIRVFSKESVLRIRCQSIEVSASASVLPMNIQD